MRVLVAGRNAKLLAAVARTFANGLSVHTAATTVGSIALLQRSEFDLIVACETLADGSGLQVLRYAAVNFPNMLRIYAARPSTLKTLKGELGLFGLFRTLPYPIDMRKLSTAVKLAKGCLDGEPPPPKIRHVVLDNAWQPEPPRAEPKQVARPSRVSAPAVPAPVPAQSLKPAPRRDESRPQPQQPRRNESRTATPERTPSQSAAFQRALARRNAAKLEADFSSSAQPGRLPQSSRGTNDRNQRREPGTSDTSLAQLARLSMKKRPIYDPRNSTGGTRRKAFFVGTGVFAALAATVLSYALLNANDSMARPSGVRTAAVQRLVPDPNAPWQQQSQPFSTVPTNANPSQASSLATATSSSGDLLETFGAEPGHPGPPQPNPPPGPSEPPAEDPDDAT